MNDFRNWREERREARRKMHDEFRARMRERYPGMMGGNYVRGSGIWTGVFILLIGLAALVKVTVLGLPEWLFSWQILLIALGVFFGIRNNFHGASWFVLMVVGGAFLVPRIYPDITFRQYIWPVVLMLVGLFIILRSRNFLTWNGKEKKKETNPGVADAKIVDETSYSKEEYIRTTSIFGGTKKSILSKDFKGADIVNIFGGTELNLGQADINGTATLDTTTIFGGVKLIIPSNWTVKSQAAVVFGGIEDKRAVTPPEGTEKILLIKGTVLFGGIDIRSY
jgi:predicted membrane protein